MKILDDRVSADLAGGRPIRLDLGSGGAGRSSFYGVDLLDLPGVAIQADLNEPLGLIPANSVAELRSSHCLEHVTQFAALMKEIHRVVLPGGSIEITVPHFSNPDGYSDPTHVRFFGIHTFNYFLLPEKQVRRLPNYFSDTRFEVCGIYVTLMPRSNFDRLRYLGAARRLNKSFIHQQDWERRLCWRLPGNEITYWLRPEK